jgi:hypothetical protein
MIATKFEILLNGSSIKHSNAQSGSTTHCISSGSEQRNSSTGTGTGTSLTFIYPHILLGLWGP